MRKHGLATALAGVALGMGAGSAWAQGSSVTLFGTVDLALTHLSNGGGSTTAMSHSGGNISRIGVRGTEDLGGGYGAGFWFESGLSAKDGSAGGPAGNFWNRRATISLTGPFGELRLGRDDSATFLNTLIFDPFLTNGVAGTNTFVMNGAPIQISSAVSYFLPKDLIPGLYGQLQYAWDPAHTPVSKRYRGLRTGYVAGPLHVSAALAKLGYTVGGDLQIANVAASYDFGTVKPELIWAREKRSGGASVRGLQLGAIANFGPHMVRASLGDYRTSGGGDANWRKLGLGYGYNLSKRTLFYASYGRVQNSNGSSRPVQAQGITVPTNTLGHSASGFDIGLRHFF